MPGLQSYLLWEMRPLPALAAHQCFSEILKKPLHEFKQPVTILNVDKCSSRPPPLKIPLHIGKVNLPDFEPYFPGTRLVQSHIALQNYSKQCIPNVSIRYNTTAAPVKHCDRLALGLDAIQSLHINIHSSTTTNAPSECQ